jgi:trehalose 6-phosphate phosphatase
LRFSVQVRPRVDWDKGAALAHLLGMLGLANPAAVFALYIGDDRTDEDAFKGEAGS